MPSTFIPLAGHASSSKYRVGNPDSGACLPGVGSAGGALRGRRRRDRRPRHGPPAHPSTIHTATVTVLEKEDRVAAHQTGHNSGRHPCRRLLQAGQPQGAAVPGRRGVHGRVLRGSTASRTRSAASSSSPPTRASCPGWTRCSSGPAPTACRSRLIGPAEAREYEPHVACVAALHVASTGIVDYAPGLPRRWPSCVEKAGGDGAPRRPGHRPAARRRRAVVVEHHRRRRSAPTTWSTAPACTPTGSPGMAGLRPPARIMPVPGRVLRAAPERRGPGPRPDLPGARPAVPVPRRAPDPDDRRQRPRRPQRGPGAGPRGLLRGAGSAPATSPRSPPTRACGGWPASISATALTEVRRSLSRRRFAASLARLVPALTGGDIVPRRRRGAGPGHRARRQPGRRLPDRARRPAGARAQRPVAGGDQLAGDRQAHRRRSCTRKLSRCCCPGSWPSWRCSGLPRLRQRRPFAATGEPGRTGLPGGGVRRGAGRLWGTVRHGHAARVDETYSCVLSQAGHSFPDLTVRSRPAPPTS